MTQTLAPDVLAALDLTIEHFNANHADTVLFVARHAGGALEADDAELVAVDSGGVDLRVVIDGTQQRSRLEFAKEATTTDEVRAEVLATIGVARERVGDAVPLTSIEQEFVRNGQLPTLVTAVESVRTITPNLREVVLEGGLESFASVGGDQFVYLMVPRVGGVPVPDDHTMAAQRASDPATAPHAAYYTVRSWDPDAGRITLWGVLHGHDDGVGGWFSRCVPGDQVACWGPREGFGAHHAAQRYLFVADESGFAAVAALIDELPADAEIDVIAETVDADHQIDFGGPRARVTWLHRGGEAPGTGTRLLDTVRSRTGDVDGLIAFGAAESRQISAIRKYLRHERSMSAGAVSMTGYWRRDLEH